MKLNEIAYEVKDSFKPNKDAVFNFVGLEHVPPDGLHVSGHGSSLEVESNKYFFKKGDILFGTLRPYFRKIAVAPYDGVCSTEFSVIRPKNDEQRDFVFYAMAQPNFIEYATTKSNGQRPRTKWEWFSDYELKDRDNEDRISIGEILRAYDDLIENNRRRIALLEEAARLIYREWFVHFRFPKHENTKFENGLPVGWEIGKIGDFATVKSGFAFKSRDWQTHGIPVVKIKNIIGDGAVELLSCDFVSAEIAQKASKFQIPEGSILIAMTGATVGKVGLFPKTKAAHYLNQRVGLFITKKHNSIENFLFPLLQEKGARAQVMNFAAGAAQPNISGKQIESIEVAVPSDEILIDYLKYSKPLFLQRENLVQQNQALTKARDLLLPRLMDGRIAV